mgnify:CR=1 FL=1
MRIGNRDVWDWYGMNGEKLPEPDAIVSYPDGSFGAIMFHYAAEGSTAKDVAATHGFDLKTVDMHVDLDDDDPIAVAYSQGSPDAVRQWQPPDLEGWRLVGKHDTEDGPTAFYIKPRPPKLQVIQDADHPF